MRGVANGSLSEVESALAAGVSPDAAYGEESIFYSPGTPVLVVACLNAFDDDIVDRRRRRRLGKVFSYPDKCETYAGARE